jgi:hypothetical protein
MPLTGPVAYWWVGGATGTTSASRFDWNVASNWRVLRSGTNWVNDKSLVIPNNPPVAGDWVSIGYGEGAGNVTSHSNQIWSPLLFGGFSGSGSTGCWICDGSTGAGLSGAIGSTFTSSLETIIVNDDYLARFGTSSILGGGLTGYWSGESYYQSQVDLLQSLQVVGMGSTDWDTLSQNPTERQKNLNLKYSRVLSVAKPKYSFWFKPVIIDSYSTQYVGITGSIASMLVLDMYPLGNEGYVNAVIDNAKLYEIIVYTPNNNISILNSKVVHIQDNTSLNRLKIDDESTIGFLEINQKYFKQNENHYGSYSLSGTYRLNVAARSLGFLTGTTFDGKDAGDIDVKLTTPNPFGYSGNPYPYVALGGSTSDYKSYALGITGTFVANTVFISNGITGYERFNVPLTKKATVDHISIKNSELYTTLTDNKDSLTIKQISLADKSVLNLRTNNGVFDNWRIGIARASSAGLTLDGGILFVTPDVQILGDPGVRFINYGISTLTGVDIRNTKQLPSTLWQETNNYPATTVLPNVAY